MIDRIKCTLYRIRAFKNNTNKGNMKARDKHIGSHITTQLVTRKRIQLDIKVPRVF